ncbi:hypothetical protein GCM10029964_078110 [Kibdelosporangium lantanae]
MITLRSRAWWPPSVTTSIFPPDGSRCRASKPTIMPYSDVNGAVGARIARHASCENTDQNPFGDVPGSLHTTSSATQ